MKPICVFGILDNQAGREIAREMLVWLNRVYDVRQVRHDGSQFEYPALKVAKETAEKEGCPVLYIHTRGAVNTWNTTIPTRRMWKEEFGNQWYKYFSLACMQEPLVVCPFVDKDRETRYNGFVANPAAWKEIDLKPSVDRYNFERLWAGKNNVAVVGLLIMSSTNNIKKVREYLHLNYGF